jgi:hypothetical protein
VLALLQQEETENEKQERQLSICGHRTTLNPDPAGRWRILTFFIFPLNPGPSPAVDWMIAKSRPASKMNDHILIANRGRVVSSRDAVVLNPRGRGRQHSNNTVAGSKWPFPHRYQQGFSPVHCEANPLT